jgi:hybrid polyketide synthase/nonribosomal peptide synthetase ACE1
MVLDDAMFPDLDLASYHKVSRPKVEGSLWLDELFSEDTLDWFVFFSSITYVTGNAGQSAYAASNGFMTSLAEQRRRRGLAGSAMNIGVIMGNGYVSRELNLDQQAYLYRVGHWWMSEQDFHQLFAECVLASKPGSIDTSEFITGLRLDNDDQKNWIENPIFQHLVSNSVDAVVGTSKTKSGVMIKAQLEEATSEEMVFEILKGELGPSQKHRLNEPCANLQQTASSTSSRWYCKPILARRCSKPARTSSAWIHLWLLISALGSSRSPG